jgi:glycine oxidase
VQSFSTVGEVEQWPDVVVVGAGIVGAAVSLKLAREGRQVALVAPLVAPPGTSTVAAGAMLGVLGEVSRIPTGDWDELELDLRLRAAAAYPAWLADVAGFAQAPGIDRGTFVVADSRRAPDVAAITAIEQVAADREIRCERVDPADVPGLAPGAGNVPAGALFLPDEGWVEAPVLLRAILEAGAATGRVHRVDDYVTSVLQGDGGVRGVATERQRELKAPQVVLCGGADAATPLDASPRTRGLLRGLLRAKGVSMTLQRTNRPLFAQAPMHAIRTPNREFACGIHVLPRGDGLYLGATNRVSRYPGMTGEVTSGELMTLIAAATRELHCELASWNVARTGFGYRPLSADGHPMVGAVALNGLFVATGTYRNGVLLAPLVADLIARELDGEGGEPLLTPDSPRRFAAGVEAATDVFAAALAQLAELERNPDAESLEPDLAVLLPALGSTVLGEHAVARRARDHLRSVLRQYPLAEVVPEALIEVCHPELIDD